METVANLSQIEINLRQVKKFATSKFWANLMRPFGDVKYSGQLIERIEIGYPETTDNGRKVISQEITIIYRFINQMNNKIK